MARMSMSPLPPPPAGLLHTVTCRLEGLAAWFATDSAPPTPFDWGGYTVELCHDTVRLTAAQPQPFGAFLGVMSHIRRWLNFALNLPINLLDIEVTPVGSMTPIRVQMQDPHHRRTPIPPLRPIFGYAAVADDLPAYLTRWFDLCSDKSRSLETYFGSFEATGISPAIRLLLVVQSLEMFHVDFVSQRVPQRYNSRQKRRTPSYTPTGKLSRIGSLEERVWDLVEQYLAQDAEAITRLLPIPDLFIVRLIDTRNYYTHGDRSHEHVIHDPDGFAALIRTARALAFIGWLRALEVPPAQVSAVTSAPHNHHRFAPYVG